jgi:peptidoglycan/LPS O-acetylase OafA/YrhL
MNRPAGTTVPPQEAPGRIAILDPLRGLAALAVMWFHFTNGGHLLDGPGLGQRLLKASGHYGWTGVEFFFVISGFVLPYALQRGSYRLRNYGAFLAKRLVRLEPPYLVSLALALALWFAASKVGAFQGEPFRIEWPRLLLHLGYLNSHFGYPPYNPVYWTLGIELQFYLGLALLFPLAVSRRAAARTGLLVLLLALSLPRTRAEVILPYLPFFVMGMATFQRHAGLLGTGGWLLLLAASGAFCVPSTSWPATLAGLAAALAIGLAPEPGPQVSGPPAWAWRELAWAWRAIAWAWRALAWAWRAIAWAGKVSYSVYLLHVLIGGRVVNLGARLAPGLAGALAVLAGAVAATLAASRALHRWVEAPAQRLSSRITFRKEG